MIRPAFAVALAVLSGLGAPAMAQTVAGGVTGGRPLRVAVNGTNPPLESVDPATNTLVGFDIDLGEAIAARLGVRIAWQDGAFAQLIPAVTTGRADMMLSGVSDLPARRESLDFVDYLRSGAQFYTLDRSVAIRSGADLCGRIVGTLRGSPHPANIAAWSEENCVKLGRPAITVAGSDRMPLLQIDLRQGRIDAGVLGSETLPALMAAEPGVYRIVTAPFTVVLQGIGFAKGNVALRDAVAGAVRQIFEDGTYARLIAKWNLESSAAPAPGINGGPLPAPDDGLTGRQLPASSAQRTGGTDP